MVLLIRVFLRMIIRNGVQKNARINISIFVLADKIEVRRNLK